MNRTHDFKKTALAIQVLAVLPITLAEPCAAATWTVNSCVDNSVGTGLTGSLRYAVTNAGDYDVVDMSGLSCGTISLQTGALVTTQQHLYLKGPGKENLTISGALQHDRILKQVLPPPGSFFGGLYLSDLSISGGDLYAYVNAAGGCIYGYTRVSLTNVNVSDCHLKGVSIVVGGAIFAKQSVTMTSSSITSSDATASGNAYYYGYAAGGAISASGLSVNTSTISGNASISMGKQRGLGAGGGIYVWGGPGNNVSITDSTISNNSAIGVNAAGGLGGAAVFHPNVAQIAITNSTISNNESTSIVGGIMMASPTIVIRNSTIADNVAKLPAPPRSSTTLWAAGLAVDSQWSPINIELQSTIVANNAQGAGGYASDFGAVELLGHSVTIGGSRNLVGAALPASVALPADTILGACPLLGPLRNNGGPTQTRALLSHSPAIDSGSNSADLAYDQRGFARVSGGSTDIGAYELDQTDAIFSASFEGCL